MVYLPTFGWFLIMVNVGKYTIHGLFGFCFLSANRLFRRRSDMAWFMMIQQFFSNLITFSIRCIRQRRNIRNTKVWLEQKVAFAYIYIYIYIYCFHSCLWFRNRHFDKPNVFLTIKSHLSGNIDQYSYHIYFSACFFAIFCLSNLSSYCNLRGDLVLKWVTV